MSLLQEGGPHWRGQREKWGQITKGCAVLKSELYPQSCEEPQGFLKRCWHVPLHFGILGRPQWRKA